jgi:hypothetical protein
VKAHKSSIPYSRDRPTTTQFEAVIKKVYDIKNKHMGQVYCAELQAQMVVHQGGSIEGAEKVCLQEEEEKRAR